MRLADLYWPQNWTYQLFMHPWFLYRLFKESSHSSMIAGFLVVQISSFDGKKKQETVGYEAFPFASSRNFEADFLKT